jgi:cell division protease FtsH
MVAEFGMSDLGPISVGVRERNWFGLFGQPGGWSEEMAGKVDSEVRKILDAAYKQARGVLLKNRGKLNRVAKALLKKETLDGEEFQKLIASGKTSKDSKKVKSNI